MKLHNQTGHESKPKNNSGPGRLFFQPNLTINQPNDKYEQEADHMADKVMRMAEGPVKQNAFFKPAVSSVQRKCAACEEEDKHVHRKESGNEKVQGGDALDSYVGSLNSSGSSLPETSRNFFEPKFGHDFSDVKIHTDDAAARSAESISALAYTSGNNIVFNRGQFAPETEGGKKLIAHELTHVIQQGNAAPGTTKINRQPKDTPYNKALVEQSKRRLKILQARLSALLGRQTDIDHEKMQASLDRKSLDENSSQINWQGSEQQEELNFAGLNKAALDISVTGNEIVFKVKFQVLFLDPKNKQFDQLKTTLLAGIALVWNQTLSGGVLGGRKFSVIPDVSLIDNLKDRQPDHWLIEVRKADTDPVVHPGCKLPQPDPKIPTSVTDTLCDNGVMNIPPLHVGKPGVVGHEMLHLFGLVDRYMMLTHQPAKKSEKPTFSLSPTRETGGRKDPLGGDDGTILSEDLNFIMMKLGVYDKEKDRTLAELPVIQKEVWRLEKIVKLGYDPDSLIPIRKDFNDKMLRDAENVP